MTRAANEWVSLYGSLEGFQRHLNESVTWMYDSPVRIRVGQNKWVECGEQPALLNGEFRILLTEPDSDHPTWDFDVEKLLPINKDSRYRSIAGEEVEVELLPSSVAKEVDEVERRVIEAAPVVQPIGSGSLVPPESPAGRCPACGAELEANVIGVICGCGAELPEQLARQLQFGLVLHDRWSTLADFQKKRILIAFARARRGRRLTRQVSFPNPSRYVTLAIAENAQASSVADVNVLREVLEELGHGLGEPIGGIIDDPFELREMWRLLREEYGEAGVWREKKKAA